MMYGYVVFMEDGSTVSEGGFDSWEEARAEADDVWCMYEEDGDGTHPVDLEICEG